MTTHTTYTLPHRLHVRIFQTPSRGAAEATAENTAESTPVHVLSEAVVELLRLQVTAITLVEASPDASPLSATLSPVVGASLLPFLEAARVDVATTEVRAWLAFAIWESELGVLPCPLSP